MLKDGVAYCGVLHAALLGDGPGLMSGRIVGFWLEHDKNSIKFDKI